MKRFAGTRHYLDSQAQSEQAAALKTTTLCRAVVCSYWLVRDRQGTLLGELCSSACPSNNLFVLPLLPYAFPLSPCRSQGHLAGLSSRATVTFRVRVPLPQREILSYRGFQHQGEDHMNYSAPPPPPPPPPVPGASQYGLSDVQAPAVPNRSNPLCAPPLSHPPIPFLVWTAPGDSAIWRGDGLPGKREKRRARSNKQRLQGSQSAETSQTSKRRICPFLAW